MQQSKRLRLSYSTFLGETTTSSTGDLVDVVIIGAGPYGLSIGTYLRARGLRFRIFGRPMQTWLTNMPEGMRLKSEGFASNLYDPDAAFTLARYCLDQGLPYADIGMPIPLETFSAYGLDFQRRMVPELEHQLVVSVRRSGRAFQVSLESGELITASKVVTAVGLSHFGYVPSVIASIPEEMMTHASKHRTFDQFRGREVTVVGAGASAADIAAGLLEAGASVQIVARKPVFRFHDPPGRIPRPLLERIQSPMTGLGPGWRSLFCTEGPLLFRQMPEKFRLEVARRHLGPAAGWFVKSKVAGHVPFHLGWQVVQADAQEGRVHLELQSRNGERRTLSADHVIAATGYTVDLRRLTFLNPEVLADIRSVEHTPVLSSNFESSVPGLYFVGAASANTFGPLVRFAYGAKFTARRLARHLARVRRREDLTQKIDRAA